MKKIFIACIILTGIYDPAQAQSQPLNKQQTVDYIEKLFKTSFYWPTPGCKVESTTLEGKILEYSVSTVCRGKRHRIDLSKANSLTIKKETIEGGTQPLVYYSVYDEGEKVDILSCIEFESDAKRLKKALEHLIELLKTEKSTDPFDN